MDYQQSIEALDEAYRQRTKNVSINMSNTPDAHHMRHEQCWWPDCDRKARTMGLCQKHYHQHKSGALFRMDSSAFPHNEMLELYTDILRCAEAMDMQPSQAVVWLIAEGVNSFERRVT